MNGNFEVEHSAYPVAALFGGREDHKTVFRITNMIELETIASGVLTAGQADSVQLRANALHRFTRAHGWRQHGIHDCVTNYIRDAVAYLTVPNAAEPKFQLQATYSTGKVMQGVTTPVDEVDLCYENLYGPGASVDACILG